MSTQSSVDSGKIKFYDRIDPVVAGGRYRLTLDHTVYDNNDNQVFSESHHQELIVTPPRITLGLKDVHAVYPPAGSQSKYGETLPHIVLRQRDIPWERNLGQIPDTDHTRPCMALLLFTEKELKTHHIAPTKRAVTDIVGTSTDRTFDTSGKTLLPQFAAVDTGDGTETARTIDVPHSLFDRIAPKLNELPYLAHVREVNTGDKELLGLKEKGFFSVIIGNRLPNDPTETFDGRHVAHLVSLVGWINYMNWRENPSNYRGPNLPTFTHLRLITLATWSFSTIVAETDIGSFDDNMNKVSENTAPLSVTLSDQDQTTADNRVTEALESGYVPLHYQTRFNEPTIAWYRGPLLPIKTQRIHRAPFKSGESAIIFDPDTGLFDVSFGVAWQIGRLLALSNPTFAAAIGQFWRKATRLEDLYEDRRQFFMTYEKVLSQELGVKELIDKYGIDELTRAIAKLVLNPEQRQGLLALFDVLSTGEDGDSVKQLSEEEKDYLLTILKSNQAE